MKVNKIKENNILNQIETSNSMIKEPIKLELNKSIIQTSNTIIPKKLPDELGQIIDLKV